MTAVSSTMIHMAENRIKIPESDDEYEECHNSRDASNSSLHEDHKDLETSPKDQHKQLHASPFTIQNVLKSERESPEQNVFSTEKLMQNTPTCEERIEHDFRNDTRSLPTPSPRYDLNSPEEYSNPNSVRVEVVDEGSCCSEDTVLSVGNEAPVYTSETSQKSVASSPSASPSNQGLTSFKHIQTHLNAISQLSQNLNINQPLLLRPNPITPNPLMFLNQSHLLFQNPLLNQIEKHANLPTRAPLVQSQFGLNQFGRPVKNGIQRPTDENRRLQRTDEEGRDLILNQGCLKFSIDNILKADFGRRITDPLHKRKTIKTRQFSEAEKAKEFVKKPETRPLDVRPEARVSEEKTEKTGAIDLSKTDEGAASNTSGSSSGDGPMVWPAWVYCTRYSDRPSSGRSKYGPSSRLTRPRTRRPKKPPGTESPASDEKRPRTAFSGPQLARLKHEFAENRYLTERRRQQLASELGLAEAQIKIWFQNKRAKIKKASGQRNPLALQLMAQGLYNHSTVPLSKEEEELQEMQARETRDRQPR